MRQRIIGFLMVVLPLGWLAWQAHYDPCGPQGKAWAQCAEPR